MSFFFRTADFFPLADVDLATALDFPTLTDATSALLFFATIKFLPELRFSHGIPIDKRFSELCLGKTRTSNTLRHAAFPFSLVCHGGCRVCGSAHRGN